MSKTAGKPEHDDLPYDPDLERRISAEILEQARWLLEQHETRNAKAERAAATVMTATGTLVALVSRVLPTAPGWWEVLLMALVAVSGVATIGCCVGAFIPRQRANGMPTIQKLREFAKQHDETQQVPIPPSQFVVDLLNTKHLDADSPLGQAVKAADQRMKWLSRAYTGLAVTFLCTVMLTFFVGVIG